MKAVLGNFRSVGDIPLATHVPLAKVAGPVAGLLELPGEGGGFWIEPLGHATLVIIPAVVEIRGDAPAVGVLPGGESDAGGGTDWGVDVEVGELDPFRSESVDVLRFHRAAKAREIRVAQVIDEDDDDIWSFC